eukprot:COSAG02_NODE_1366_length_13032_cov_721.428207_4_plen_83_part_00
MAHGAKCYGEVSVMFFPPLGGKEHQSCNNTSTVVVQIPVGSHPLRGTGISIVAHPDFHEVYRLYCVNDVGCALKLLVQVQLY